MGEKTEYRGYEIEIAQDETYEDVREWDCLCKMLCLHDRYKLGDDDVRKEFQNAIHYFDDGEREEEYDPETWAGTIKLLGEIYGDIRSCMTELYLYDHSGLTISSTPFPCPWDSGKIGVAFVTQADIVKEFGAFNGETVKRAREVMEGEIRTYDKQLRGDVWGYIVTKDGEHVDSCWGYFDDDGEPSGSCALAEAKHWIDYEIEYWEKQDKLINNLMHL